MMMTDEQFDFSWKSNQRPKSTIAENFSITLNELFKIENSVSDLDAAVFEKKKAVSTQTLELKALEERLKATEEQLKRAGISPPPVLVSQNTSHQQESVPNDALFTSKAIFVEGLAYEAYKKNFYLMGITHLKKMKNIAAILKVLPDWPRSRQ